jgi:hypothetical protein
MFTDKQGVHSIRSLFFNGNAYIPVIVHEIEQPTWFTKISA